MYPTQSYTNTSCFTYNPIEINESLKKENEELKKKLDKYEKLIDENDTIIIDGHLCYREMADKKITDLIYDTANITQRDISIEVYIKFLYKDIDTDEVIAERTISKTFEG